MRINVALFNEAWKYKEIAEYWNDKGLKGCEVDAWSDSLALMKLRKKFVLEEKK
jgi:hypothetical protein